MERVLEPEVMDDPEQVCAYAGADFEQENQGFVHQFLTYFPDVSDEHIVDLGCGPADIPIRLARALPSCRITGVDASQPMLEIGRERLSSYADRLDFVVADMREIGDAGLPPADVVVSSRAAHHLTYEVP